MDAITVKHRLAVLNITKAALAREMGINACTLWRFLSGTHVPRKPFLMAVEVALNNIKLRVDAERINKNVPCVNNKPTPVAKRYSKLLQNATGKKVAR